MESNSGMHWFSLRRQGEIETARTTILTNQCNCAYLISYCKVSLNKLLNLSLIFVILFDCIHCSPLCLYLGRGGEGERVGTLE